jgi:methylthioribose-1-phosphate isomerase
MPEHDEVCRGSREGRLPADHPSQVRTLEWREGAVVMIDQRVLPAEETYVTCGDWRQVGNAIRDMVVRGAPAIGVAAAMGMGLAAREALASHGPDRAAFRRSLQDATEGLFATRPTAYNLQWALDEMRRIWQRDDLTPEEVTRSMEQRALEIYADDLASCRAIGEHGAQVIDETAPGRPTILTHCNAGALATAGYGTALGVVRSVFQRHPGLHVFVDETRPFLQGARLTAWELLHEGISSDLITDNMAGHFLAQGMITHVVVGADRIAANGDTANKIGTYTLSVLAREHAIPLPVSAPLSPIDLSLADGTHIPIEERSAEEVTHFAGRRVAPEGVRVRNPAFDVTPARNITAIVTERGVARPPFGESLKALATVPGPGRGRLTGGAC